jgi:hypothetical protein
MTTRKGVRCANIKSYVVKSKGKVVYETCTVHTKRLRDQCANYPQHFPNYRFEAISNYTPAE